MSVPGEIFVSPKQMAEKLGIHRTTVYSMVREGLRVRYATVLTNRPAKVCRFTCITS